MVYMGSDARKLPECLPDANIVSMPEGARIFQPGDACSQFVYLLNGIVRVDLITKSGKPITLYRFGGGETCVMTTSCLLGGDDYCAAAYVEQPVRAATLPRTAFQEKLKTSEDFRQLVFSSFASRLAAMMTKIEEIASTPIDIRLAQRLIELGDGAAALHVTHDQLAADLGTAREVISRKLAQWEQLKLLERGRGRVEILNGQRLQEIANPE